MGLQSNGKGKTSIKNTISRKKRVSQKGNDIFSWRDKGGLPKYKQALKACADHTEKRHRKR